MKQPQDYDLYILKKHVDIFYRLMAVLGGNVFFVTHTIHLNLDWNMCGQ